MNEEIERVFVRKAAPLSTSNEQLRAIRIFYCASPALSLSPSLSARSLLIFFVSSSHRSLFLSPSLSSDCFMFFVTPLTRYKLTLVTSLTPDDFAF